MYNEGVPEFFVNQGHYYPTAPSYGYYCTGFEPPSEWEDHVRVFAADGPDIQYTVAQNESSPYTYYTPSYGYAESPYNPYNPFIPGALVGSNGTYVGAPQYYPITPNQDPISSPGYVPYIVQPDFIPTNYTDPLLDTGVAFTNTPDARGLKHGLSSSSALPKSQTKPTLNQSHPLPKIPEGQRANAGTSKQSLMHGRVSSSSFPTSAPSRTFQGRSASGSDQPVDKISNGKFLPPSNQLKFVVAANSGISGPSSSAIGQTSLDKLQPKIHVSGTLHDVSGRSDAFGEQNRGPRTNKVKNHLAVKAFTNKLGDSNGHGNIIIYIDQFNKDNFPVDYADAKFFVIKSYSEDDVHKSIKYNVWSSTPNGNKKLQSAYEDAQKIAAGKLRPCPIFLFFSVNASGQFCGVAQMIGPVDFLKDMDFWQQDKWSGSFPVKWHIIKDVPNSIFRHIILENNENKPVTNSRDTQEITYKQGLEMLKIFKNHLSKTSLLDDFMYYENRQKIMQEEKARLVFRQYEMLPVVSIVDPGRTDTVVEQFPSKEEKSLQQNGLDGMKKAETCETKPVASSSDFASAINSIVHIEQAIANSGDTIASGLDIDSLRINSEQGELKPSPSVTASAAHTDSVDIVTVGSVPIKVNGFAESSSILRVGSIPLDPRAPGREKGESLARHD